MPASARLSDAPDWLNRRTFLQTSAVAAGAGVLSLTAADPSRRIPVGFLGIEHSHFTEKHRLLKESSEFELVGLCEENAEVRARGPKEARWLSAAELFREAEVVVVEGAVRHHSRDARRALEAGCHVHVEKPPTTSLEELRNLFRVAQERRRWLQVGYMWRYNPGLNVVLEAARSGWLGDVFLVRAMINTFGDAERRREWAEFKGGILFELGCHLLDPIVRLMGRPKRMESVLGRGASGTDALADNTTVLMEFAQGMAFLSCAAVQPGAGKHRGFEVQGTNGVARVQPLEPPTVMIDLVQAAGPYAKGPREVPVPPYQRYVGEFQALAAAIRQGDPLPVSAETDLQVQEVLLEACGMQA